MENSSSDVQWTLMVSYDAVHSSSLMDGALGAVKNEAHNHYLAVTLKSYYNNSNPNQHSTCPFGSIYGLMGSLEV